MPPDPRSPGEVISEAIGRNRVSEYLLYAVSALCLCSGLGVLFAGVYRGEGLTQVVGACTGSFFYPAMRLAQKVRDQNLAIMLLEIPLTKSETAEEAARILEQFFRSTIGGGSGSGNGNGKDS